MLSLMLGRNLEGIMPIPSALKRARHALGSILLVGIATSDAALAQLIDAVPVMGLREELRIDGNAADLVSPAWLLTSRSVDPVLRLR